MAAFTANQVTIDNGSNAAVINSEESTDNIQNGDFLVVGDFAPAQINRTYVNSNNLPVIELVKPWRNSSQSTQPAIVIPTTVNFKDTATALRNANTLVNDNMRAMQDWQTKTGLVSFNNLDGTVTVVKTIKQMQLDFLDMLEALRNNDPIDPVDPTANGVMKGTYLYILDSLTGGPGNIKPPPRYVAEKAMQDGRLRFLWVRPILASSGATETIISVTGSSWGGMASVLTPNGTALAHDGLNPFDSLEVSSYLFPYLSVDIKYLETDGENSFDVVIGGVTTTVNTQGTSGAIGSATVINPNGAALSTIRITNVIGGMTLAGFNLKVADIPYDGDFVDVINIAIPGKTTANYNLVTNISDWYREFGINRAVINTGTNDVGETYTDATNNLRLVMEGLLDAGVLGTNILILRPNQNGRSLGDMWEDIRDEYNTKFASIVRIYGNLTEFESKNWMATGDRVHPNDTFNEIQALANYNNQLVSMHDALDLGVQPNWLTDFIATTYIDLDSQAVISGDFTAEIRLKFAGRSYYVWDNSDDYANYLYINAEGSIRFRINGNTYNSAEGLIVSGWQTLVVTRVGSTLTFTVNGVVVYSNESITTDDVRFTRLVRWQGGLSLSGAMAWVYILNQHLWLMNQNHDENVILDHIGDVNAHWVGREDSAIRVIKYSIMPNGELLDYHYGTPSGIQWGDARWPELP